MNIINLPIDRLINHPDNPRKDLGDLTELAESIKAKGVLQNLTVVPDVRRVDGDLVKNYLVVIGNRRRAAAEIAGLTELPCVIADMTEKEQYETMMLENLQREDLTVYEQAMGFQTLFDFGDSVEMISEKTGFSQSTIRRRLKIAELDKDTLKTVSERPLSLMDFEKLFEIRDESERNGVLKHIGTNNFDGSLLAAKRRQEEVMHIEKWRNYLNEYGATEIKADEIWSGKYITLDSYRTERSTNINLPDCKLFYGFQYGWVYIKKEKSAEEFAEIEEKRIEDEKRRAELDARDDAREEAAERAFELRKSFIEQFTSYEAKSKIDTIICFLLRRWWDDAFNYVRYDRNLFAELIGYEGSNDKHTDRDVAKHLAQAPIYSFLAWTYATFDDDEGDCYFDWQGKYYKNHKLDLLYEFLHALGYEMSDEEIEMQNGTSHLFEEV